MECARPELRVGMFARICHEEPRRQPSRVGRIVDHDHEKTGLCSVEVVGDGVFGAWRYRVGGLQSLWMAQLAPQPCLARRKNAT